MTSLIIIGICITLALCLLATGAIYVWPKKLAGENIAVVLFGTASVVGLGLIGLSICSIYTLWW